mgnify:CR=1 FL=1
MELFIVTVYLALLVATCVGLGYLTKRTLRRWVTYTVQQKVGVSVVIFMPVIAIFALMALIVQ